MRNEEAELFSLIKALLDGKKLYYIGWGTDKDTFIQYDGSKIVDENKIPHKLEDILHYLQYTHTWSIRE